MFRTYFFLLIILVPAAEIGILLWSGKTIGIFPTFLLILLTGVLGTYFARSQGLKVIHQARQQMGYGQMPGEAVLDGICVLVGGALLLAPGIITDLIGLLLLIPQTRKFFKHWLAASFRRWINRGTIRVIK
ncbi:FxsA family protein [Bacillus sp. FJAT-27445]|uniref:FxsA family protein n=1 Tax=Bacillus sp. FJAT-27445 TaxID=1679166 RepID=UPI0007439BCB|nr:FxsA family protein [Bacillus sp. FJAT-27445]